MCGSYLKRYVGPFGLLLRTQVWAIGPKSNGASWTGSRQDSTSTNGSWFPTGPLGRHIGRSTKGPQHGHLVPTDAPASTDSISLRSRTSSKSEDLRTYCGLGRSPADEAQHGWHQRRRRRNPQFKVEIPAHFGQDERLSGQGKANQEPRAAKWRIQDRNGAPKLDDR